MSRFFHSPRSNSPRIHSENEAKSLSICRSLSSCSVDGVLLVHLPKPNPKHFLKKRSWTMRYCVLKYDELFVYKNEMGKGENVERMCWKLRNARNLKIHVHVEKQGVATLIHKNPLRFIEILDEFGDKLRLSFKDDDEMNFWLVPLMKVFHKFYPYNEDRSIGMTNLAFLNSGDGNRNIPISDQFSKQSELKQCTNVAIKSTIKSEIDEEKLKRANGSFKKMLSIQEEVFKKRRAELKNLLNESVSDDKNKSNTTEDQCMPISSLTYPISSSFKNFTSTDKKSTISRSSSKRLISGEKIATVSFVPSIEEMNAESSMSLVSFQPSSHLKSISISSISAEQNVNWNPFSLLNSSMTPSLQSVKVSQKITEDVIVEPVCAINVNEAKSATATINSNANIQQNEDRESFDYQKYLLSIWNRRIANDGPGATEKGSDDTEYSSKFRTESLLSTAVSSKNAKQSSEYFCSSCYSNSSSSWNAESYVCSFCKNRNLRIGSEKIEPNFNLKLKGIEKFYIPKMPTSRITGSQQMYINTGAGDSSGRQTSEFIKRMREVFEGKDSLDMVVIKSAKYAHLSAKNQETAIVMPSVQKDSLSAVINRKQLAFPFELSRSSQ